jgi:DNA primase catalytic core
MAMVSQAELDELKGRVDLAELVRSKGIRLEKHGKDLKGLCPFHADETPSLIVSPGKNLFHCPSCGAGGDAIAFLRRFDGVSFRHAVELLREGKWLGPMSADGTVLRSPGARKLEPPVEPSADDHRQLGLVADYYHKRLLETAPAQDYLKKRGLFCLEAAQAFKLGYCDRTLGLRLPARVVKAGAELRGQLQRLGIYRESGHEHFRGCLTMPVLDAEGTVTEIYGRRIDDHPVRQAPRHLYLPGPHRGVWNLPAFASPFFPAGVFLEECAPGRSLILCEALLDALSFWVCGLRNVTASYGVAGFTPDHLRLLVDRRIRTVFIAYDRDAAGERASGELAARLAAEGIDCRRIEFPAGIDANAHLVATLERHGNDHEAARLEFARLARAARILEPGESREPRATAGDAATESLALPAEPEAPPAVAEPASSLAAASPATPASAGEPEPAATPPPVIPSLPPSPAPPAPSLGIPCTINGEDIELSLGDRRYRIRGLAKNTSFDIMKVNIRVLCGDFFHVDTLDLYNARHRQAFIHAAALELRLEEDVLRRDIGRALLKLEELQEALLAKAAEPERGPAVPQMSDAEREAALGLLRDPGILERIAADFELAGLAGERRNALAAYLAAVSRKTADPLAVIIQSSSSAGKSSLLDAVLAFMPEEETIRFTAMTGQSLFYMGGSSLANKILAVSEEEGAEQAGYALKILQSEKRLRIASTGKDPKSGRLVTHEYAVEGPAAIMLTTTAIDVDEELLNRCLLLTVDEDREQTRRIHHLQRRGRTLDGLLLREERSHAVTLHHNAQRLLRPLPVVNPYAERLTFADGRLRTRRDHVKYLNLIGAVALLRQFQKPLRSVSRQGRATEYVEVDLADIAAANRLAAEIMGTSLDELPPQTRKLLSSVRDLAEEIRERQQLEWEDIRLTRRDIRERAGWSNTQLGIHLDRLVEMEFLFVWKGRGRQILYEPAWRGEGLDGRRFLLNLVDPATLETAAKPQYDGTCTGPASPCTPHPRHESAPSSDPDRTHKPLESSPLADTGAKTPEKHIHPPVTTSTAAAPAAKPQEARA